MINSMQTDSTGIPQTMRASEAFRRHIEAIESNKLAVEDEIRRIDAVRRKIVEEASEGIRSTAVESWIMANAEQRLADAVHSIAARNTAQSAAAASTLDYTRKYDAGKVKPSLLFSGCAKAVAGVLAVLDYGIEKYKVPNSWKNVESAEERYTDAMYRHMLALASGETNDPESGLPHIDHIATNAIFLSEFHHAK